MPGIPSLLLEDRRPPIVHFGWQQGKVHSSLSSIPDVFMVHLGGRWANDHERALNFNHTTQKPVYTKSSPRTLPELSDKRQGTSRRIPCLFGVGTKGKPKGSRGFLKKEGPLLRIKVRSSPSSSSTCPRKVRTSALTFQPTPVL